VRRYQPVAVTGTNGRSLAAPVGIYLVGWFDKLKWDGTDYRRSDTPDWSVEQAQGHLDQQAGPLSKTFIVKAVVLDCHAP